MKQKRGDILTFSISCNMHDNIPDVYIARNDPTFRNQHSLYIRRITHILFKSRSSSREHPSLALSSQASYLFSLASNITSINQPPHNKPPFKNRHTNMHFHTYFMLAMLPLISGAPTATHKRQLDTLLGAGTSSSPFSSTSDLSRLGSLLGDGTGTSTSSGLDSWESSLASLGSLGSATGTSSGLASLESEISSLTGGTGTLTGASASSSADGLNSLLSGLKAKEKKV